MTFRTCALALGVLATAGTLQAAIVLNQVDTFDSAPGNWFIGQGTVGDTSLGAGPQSPMVPGGGPTGPFLQFTLDYGDPPALLDVIISNNVDYAGNYAAFGDALTLSFDFYASNAAPTAAALFFNTSAGDQWTLNILPSITGTGWSRISALFDSSGSGWVQQSGSSSFAASLTSVTTVGLFLEGLVGGDEFQVFGIDNWVYSVPEPGTMAMLGAAFLSMAATFRRPLQETLRKKKAERDA